ncbi:MAG: DNA polymerase IV [Halioglobus sp.]
MDSPRKIIHVDADSFYASVEMRENPELRGKPIAVGGQAERRGVIATCNYEARKYGVHSAMASSRAQSLCPGLVIVPPRFELYRSVSTRFREIFSDYTELIEPLSLDEAYLDVTGNEDFSGSATLIAEAIRQRVRDELELTVSAGVAPNKFLAKVASDWNKPDGVFTIPPEDVAEFVRTLPVNKINGVGAVTTRKLQKMGVVTCGDLQGIPLTDLVKRFGKYGKRLSEVSRGIDNRAVQSSRVRKSISVEHTYSEDIADLAGVIEALDTLLDELSQRYKKLEDTYRPSKRVVKIKFNDFTQTTLEEGLAASGEDWCHLGQFQRLMAAAWPRGAKPVRLLGLGLRLQPRAVEDEGQLALFE